VSAAAADGTHNCSTLTYKIAPNLTFKFMILLKQLLFRVVSDSRRNRALFS
jgi:hypothetical protein